MKDSNDYRPNNDKHEVLLINSVNGQDIAFGRFTTIDEDMLDLTEEELEKMKEFSRPIPNISLRQCSELLIRTGRFQEVVTIINSIEDETERLIVENYFNNSQEFERNHHMLGLLTTALGMSEIEVDDFFLEASEL
jgi:hypothetical protein